MSFKINLYSFAKDSNSTAQPAGSGTELTCNILSPADIIAPLVEIKHTDPTAFNYAYIAAFHRYYFIEGITYNEGLWILNLRCDVLATYKTEIGAQSLYVLRAASDYDGNITDNYYPMLNNISYSRQIDPTYLYTDYSSGYIYLNIAGSNTTGDSTIYQLTPSNYRLLIKALYDGIDGFQFSDIIKSVVKSFGGNPEKLINGALWMPTRIADASVNDSPVMIGSWNSGITGKIINDPTKSDASCDFTIAVHPQVAARGRYLNLSPYSRYLLYLPGVGITALDTTRLSGINKIRVTRMVDVMSGIATYTVKTVPSGSDPDAILNVAETQWGVPITLGGNNAGSSVINGALNTIGGAALAVATGGAGAIIGAVSAGIGTLASAMEGANCGSNTGGNLNAQGNPIRLDTIFVYVTDADTVHNGRPLMQTRTISTLSGFIIVQKGDVPIAGTSQEADEIRSLLEGGFYYE